MNSNGATLIEMIASLLELKFILLLEKIMNI